MTATTLFSALMAAVLLIAIYFSLRAQEDYWTEDLPRQPEENKQ